MNGWRSSSQMRKSRSHRLSAKYEACTRNSGVSTVLVAGSSGDFLTVADTVLQMDCYTARDVTERAKELAADLIQEKAEKKEWLKNRWRKDGLKGPGTRLGYGKS